MFGLRYLQNVTTLALNESKCGGCGMCVTVCPHEVLAVDQGKARIVDRDACMECGACARNCPRGAVTVKSGVGCLEAIVRGALAGTEPTCDCAKDHPSACCGGR
jgi:NAD-dependent dihydropyrimidine dehydrogenase PreA subunit